MIWQNSTRSTCKAGAAATTRPRNGSAGPTSSRFSSLLHSWPCWPMRSLRPYREAIKKPAQALESRRADRQPKRQEPARRNERSRRPCVLIAALGGFSRADNPADAVRDGLRWYGKGEFDKARERFAAAREQFDTADADKAAIAAFDQACARAPQGRRGAGSRVVSEGGAGARQGAGGRGPLQPGNARRRRGRPAGGRPPGKCGRPRSAPRSSTSCKRRWRRSGTAWNCSRTTPRPAATSSSCGSGSSITPTAGKHAIARQRRQETNLVAFLEFLIETQRSLAGIGQVPHVDRAGRRLRRAEAAAR